MSEVAAGVTPARAGASGSQSSDASGGTDTPEPANVAAPVVFAFPAGAKVVAGSIAEDELNMKKKFFPQKKVGTTYSFVVQEVERQGGNGTDDQPYKITRSPDARTLWVAEENILFAEEDDEDDEDEDSSSEGGDSLEIEEEDEEDEHRPAPRKRKSVVAKQGDAKKMKQPKSTRNCRKRPSL